MSGHVSDHRLALWALDELSGDEHAALERHLAECKPCRERAAAERRLDEWILATGDVPSPGEGERVLARFWSALDTGDASGRRSDVVSRDVPRDRRGPGPARRPLVLVRAWPWLGAAAVLLAAWLLSERDDRLPSSTPVPDDLAELDEVAEEIRSVDEHRDAAPQAPSASPDEARPAGATVDADPLLDETQSLDPQRLAAARGRMNAVLLGAAELFPFQDESFLGACDEGLLSLRREGWPVTSLLRGVALGEDELAAAAALRFAVLDPSTRHLAAAALDRPERAEVTLELLSELAVDVDGSPATVAALERLVLSSKEREVRLAALAVLAAQSGPRSRRSLERLVEATTRALPAGRRRDEARRELLDLLAEGPASFAVPAALALLEQDERLAVELTALLVRRCEDDPLVGAASLRAALATAPRDERLPALVASAGLRSLVPELLARLEAHPSETSVRRALVDLGGSAVSRGLFLLWREEQDRSARAAFADALIEVLTREPRLLGDLGTSTPDGALDDLVAFADVLPDALRTAPLWSALVSRPSGARAGRPETLLAALARLGAESDGRALLAWLDARPPSDDLAPLAWAAAAALAPSAAERAFAFGGRDPRALRDAARVASARFRVDELPSSSQLSSLRRALQRDRSPPR